MTVKLIEYLTLQLSSSFFIVNKLKPAYTFLIQITTILSSKMPGNRFVKPKFGFTFIIRHLVEIEMIVVGVR